MLSDDRLENLLRDAHALESFDHSGVATPAKELWTNRWGQGGGRRSGWLLAAAAAVALIVVPVVMLNGGKAKSAGQHAPPGTDAVAAPPRASLLMAVYQNDAGKFSCVNWSADALKGRKISSLSAEELTRIGLTLSCDPAAARILVVGLEGPASALPSSDARAHAVAQCLTSSPPCASGVFNPQTCASAGCLAQEVTVRVESLALK